MAFLHISLAGGWDIFGAFLVVFLLAVVAGLYTRGGSAINQRPWGDVHGDAPGALGASVLDHDESAATVYTRSRRRGRHRPSTR
ncbi:MAG: hypothetical protein ABI317_08435 [Gaiellales bacterium]